MTVTLKQVYKQFPKEEDAIKFLEKILWNNTPICPYCKTSFSSPIEKGRRYRCNKCNTNFSITARTLFHRSKVDLRKWFYCLAIAGITEASLRTLAGELGVTKDTVLKMIKRIKTGYLDNQELILAIQNKLSNE